MILIKGYLILPSVAQQYPVITRGSCMRIYRYNFTHVLTHKALHECSYNEETMPYSIFFFFLTFSNCSVAPNQQLDIDQSITSNE